MRISTTTLACLSCALLFVGAIPGCGASKNAGTDAGADSAPPDTTGKIKHVVLIMQENRSFDHYFGMFPGADGFTLDAKGEPTNSNVDPFFVTPGGKPHVVRVFHDPEDFNADFGHDSVAFSTGYDNGMMDGFLQ